jgi:hypothetical protein
VPAQPSSPLTTPSLAARRGELERRLFQAILGSFILLSWAPIWLTEYAPLPDTAVHLASASIWTHLDNPEYHLREFYSLSLGVTPYWGYYLLIRIFAVFFSLMTANRLVLSLYVLAWALGFLRLLNQLGHSRWLTLGAFAYLWSFSFNLGFIHCALSFALVPWALAEFDAFCAQPSIRRGFVAALLGVAIYFNHLLGWGLYLGASGLMGLMYRGRSLRQLLPRALVWSAVLVVGIIASVMGRGKGMGSGIRHAAFSGRNSPLELCRMLFDNIWNLCAAHETQWAGAIILLATIALIVTAKWPRSLHAWRGAALSLTALTAYFLLPRSVLQPSYIWGVSFRFATMGLLGLLLCIPGVIAGARVWLLVPIVAASLFIQGDAWAHWRRSSRLVAGFDEVAALPPSGARVLFIVREPWRDPTSAINYVNPYSWYQVLRGGYNPWNFEDGFPIRYDKRLPAPEWRNPSFDWATQGNVYDYVIGFNAPAAVPPRPGQAVQLLAKGRWTVWRIFRSGKP